MLATVCLYFQQLPVSEALMAAGRAEAAAAAASEAAGGQRKHQGRQEQGSGQPGEGESTALLVGRPEAVNVRDGGGAGGGGAPALANGAAAAALPLAWQASGSGGGGGGALDKAGGAQGPAGQSVSWAVLFGRVSESPLAHV